MVDDSAVFTLGVFLSLPIAKYSTLRVVTSHKSGNNRTLFQGLFSDLQDEVHKREDLHPYRKIKLIAMGGGNRNAIIMLDGE